MLSDMARAASVAVYHYWAMKRHHGGPLLRCYQSFPLLVNWQRRDTAPKAVQADMLSDPAARARVMESYNRMILLRKVSTAARRAVAASGAQARRDDSLDPVAPPSPPHTSAAAGPGARACDGGPGTPT